MHKFVSHNTSALKLRTSPLTTTNTTPFENPTTLGTATKQQHTSAQFVTTTEHPFTTTKTSASKFVNSSIEQYTEYEQVFDDSFVANHSTVFEYSSQLKHTDSINSTILMSALENANNTENKSTSEKKTIPYGNHTITSQSESSHRERSYKSESVLVGCSVFGGIAVLLLVACAIYMKFGKPRWAVIQFYTHILETNKDETKNNCTHLVRQIWNEVWPWRSLQLFKNKWYSIVRVVVVCSYQGGD